MKVKISKAIKAVFMFLGILFLWVVLGGLLSAFFKDYEGIIMTIVNFIVTSYFILKVLKFYSWIYDIIEIRRLKKEASTRDKSSLYMWTGNSVDYSFFYEILSEEIEHDTIIKLILIKEKIKNKVGSKKSDYYLLLKYLDVKGKNDILQICGKILGGLILAALTTIFSKFMISNEVVSYIGNIFFHLKTNKYVDDIEILVNILNGIIFIMSLIIVIVHEFTREKRKIELIKGIIESIIYEKENS